VTLKFENIGDTLNVYIAGDIDHHSAKGIREQINEKINTAMPKILVMNFAGVEFMDSSGLGIILGRYRLMQSMGGTAMVTGVKRQIYKILKLSGVDKIMQIAGEE
jgi:stage II sporulation protein AA (anti-sigma F factor antagonist)